MAYRSFRLGGGLQTKAAEDVIPDNGLTVSRGCSFDTVGALGSARGRDKLNGGTVVGSGSILGHFDGYVSGTKQTYTKSGAAVHKDFAVASLGTPAAIWPGRTAIGWSSTGTLTGFAYGGYIYLADGTTASRYNPTTAAMETWGLTSPGYQELTTAPLSTASGDATVTVATTYPTFSGMGTSGDQNIELVGLEVPATSGLLATDINKLHHAFSSTDADVAVSGGPANSTTVTVSYQRYLAATSFPLLDIDTDDLTGSFVVAQNRTTPGSSDPPTNEVQTFSLVGATGGSYRLRHQSSEWSPNIAAAADADTIKAALVALSNISGSTTTSTAATMTGASSFTFEAASGNADATTSAGGGTIGFMRQGPVCTITTSGGGLEGGRYFYAYSFYNGVAESNFSAQVPVEVVTRNSLVTLTKILPGPVGTTERRLYRTDVNQRQLYYIGKISDNTTTQFIDYNKLPPGADPYTELGDVAVDKEFEDSVLNKLSARKQAERRGLIQAEQDRRDEARRNTNLGLLSDWTDHDPPPATLEEVGILNETVFGVDLATGEIRFSKTAQPEHFPLDNRLKPGRNTSEKALTWRAFDRDCIIYTANGLYRFSQIGLDFTDSRFEEIESPVGLAGKRAVAQLDGQQGHIFLATNGLYLFDGARVSEVSYPIEELFSDSTHDDYINPSYMSTAIMVASRDRVYFSYGSDAANDRLMVIDFQDMSDPKYTVIPWSFTALFRERVDNRLVGGDASSYVYQLDTGYSDDGSSIEWDWTTKQYRLNDGMGFMLDEVFLDADLDGTSTNVTVTVQQRSSSKTCTFTLDDDGRQRIRMKVPTYMRGEGVTVALSSSGATKRTAYELGFTYLPMGEP